jgi:hypothetical protein
VPNRLASSAAADLLRHQGAGIWHAVLVAGVASIGALALAIHRLSRREIHAGESPGA